MSNGPRVERGQLLATLAGVAITATGLWAFLAPRSFYDALATYPPYNEHLLHDIGAFMAGLGVALLAASRFRSGLTVALIANAAGAILHAISHVIDRDSGGKATDPWFFAVVGLVFAVAAFRRARAS